MKSLLIFGMLFVGLLVSCSDVDREDPSGLIGAWRESVAPSSSSTVVNPSSSSTVVNPSSSGTVSAGNSQNCTYSTSNNTLTCTEKTYKTVVIGTQTWMAENLNFGEMLQGLAILQDQNDAVIEKACYNNEESYCTSDGGLYTWSETMALPRTCNSNNCISKISLGNHQGICPTGWHIPKSAEWDSLAVYLGGASVAGKKMKLDATGNSSWDAISSNDGNSSGFSAFPTGVRNNGSTNVSYRGSRTYFWVATQYNEDGANIRSLSIGSELSAGNNFSKGSGFSVRCLKD